MFCSRFFSGAGALALHSALLAVCTDAAAQTAAQTLPGITVEAPRRAQASPRKKRSVAHRDAPRSSPRPQPAVVVRPSPVSTDTQLATLHQAPTGQPQTTIGRDLFANRPSFSVADVLRDSPGISIKQGNGPRDFGISIRGSNARNGFAIRNLVIFDDGFPVTQPDGLSRSDLIDPRAYGAIDVIRGPSVRALRQLRDWRRAELQDPSRRRDQRRRVRRRCRELRIPQQLSDCRQESRKLRGLSVRKRRAQRWFSGQQLVQHPDRELSSGRYRRRRTIVSHSS